MATRKKKKQLVTQSMAAAALLASSVVPYAVQAEEIQNDTNEDLVKDSSGGNTQTDNLTDVTNNSTTSEGNSEGNSTIDETKQTTPDTGSVQPTVPETPSEESLVAPTFNKTYDITLNFKNEKQTEQSIVDKYINDDAVLGITEDGKKYVQMTIPAASKGVITDFKTTVDEKLQSAINKVQEDGSTIITFELESFETTAAWVKVDNDAYDIHLDFPNIKEEYIPANMSDTGILAPGYYKIGYKSVVMNELSKGKFPLQLGVSSSSSKSLSQPLPVEVEATADGEHLVTFYVNRDLTYAIFMKDFVFSQGGKVLESEIIEKTKPEGGVVAYAQTIQVKVPNFNDTLNISYQNKGESTKYNFDLTFDKESLEKLTNATPAFPDPSNLADGKYEIDLTYYKVDSTTGEFYDPTEEISTVLPKATLEVIDGKYFITATFKGRKYENAEKSFYVKLISLKRDFWNSVSNTVKVISENTATQETVVKFEVANPYAYYKVSTTNWLFESKEPRLASPSQFYLKMNPEGVKRIGDADKIEAGYYSVPVRYQVASTESMDSTVATILGATASVSIDDFGKTSLTIPYQQNEESSYNVKDFTSTYAYEELKDEQGHIYALKFDIPKTDSVIPISFKMTDKETSVETNKELLINYDVVAFSKLDKELTFSYKSFKIEDVELADGVYSVDVTAYNNSATFDYVTTAKSSDIAFENMILTVKDGKRTLSGKLKNKSTWTYQQGLQIETAYGSFAYSAATVLKGPDFENKIYHQEVSFDITDIGVPQRLFYTSYGMDNDKVQSSKTVQRIYVDPNSIKPYEAPAEAGEDLIFNLSKVGTGDMDEFIVNYLGPYFEKPAKVKEEDGVKYAYITLTGKLYIADTIRYTDKDGVEKPVEIVEDNGKTGLERVRVMKMPIIDDTMKVYVDGKDYGQYYVNFDFKVKSEVGFTVTAPNLQPGSFDIASYLGPYFERPAIIYKENGQYYAEVTFNGKMYIVNNLQYFNDNGEKVNAQIIKDNGLTGMDRVYTAKFPLSSNDLKLFIDGGSSYGTYVVQLGFNKDITSTPSTPDTGVVDPGEGGSTTDPETGGQTPVDPETPNTGETPETGGSLPTGLAPVAITHSFTATEIETGIYGSTGGAFIENYLKSYFTNAQLVTINGKRFIEMELIGKAYAITEISGAEVIAKLGEKMDQVRVIRIPAGKTSTHRINAGEYGIYDLTFTFGVTDEQLTEIPPVVESVKQIDQDVSFAFDADGDFNTFTQTESYLQQFVTKTELVIAEDGKAYADITFGGHSYEGTVLKEGSKDGTDANIIASTGSAATKNLVRTVRIALDDKYQASIYFGSEKGNYTFTFDLAEEKANFNFTTGTTNDAYFSLWAPSADIVTTTTGKKYAYITFAGHSYAIKNEAMTVNGEQANIVKSTGSEATENLTRVVRVELDANNQAAVTLADATKGKYTFTFDFTKELSFEETLTENNQLINFTVSSSVTAANFIVPGIMEYTVAKKTTAGIAFGVQTQVSETARGKYKQFIVKQGDNVLTQVAAGELAKFAVQSLDNVTFEAVYESAGKDTTYSASYKNAKVVAEQTDFTAHKTGTKMNVAAITQHKKQAQLSFKSLNKLVDAATTISQVIPDVKVQKQDDKLNVTFKLKPTTDTNFYIAKAGEKVREVKLLANKTYEITQAFTNLDDLFFYLSNGDGNNTVYGAQLQSVEVTSLQATKRQPVDVSFTTVDSAFFTNAQLVTVDGKKALEFTVVSSEALKGEQLEIVSTSGKTSTVRAYLQDDKLEASFTLGENNVTVTEKVNEVKPAEVAIVTTPAQLTDNTEVHANVAVTDVELGNALQDKSVEEIQQVIESVQKMIQAPTVQKITIQVDGIPKDVIEVHVPLEIPDGIKKVVMFDKDGNKVGEWPKASRVVASLMKIAADAVSITADVDSLEGISYAFYDNIDATEPMIKTAVAVVVEASQVIVREEPKEEVVAPDEVASTNPSESDGNQGDNGSDGSGTGNTGSDSGSGETNTGGGSTGGNDSGSSSGGANSGGSTTDSTGSTGSSDYNNTGDVSVEASITHSFKATEVTAGIYGSMNDGGAFITNYLHPYFTNAQLVTVNGSKYIQMTLIGKAYGIKSFSGGTFVSSTGDGMSQVRVLRVAATKSGTYRVNAGDYGIYDLTFTFDVTDEQLGSAGSTTGDTKKPEETKPEATTEVVDVTSTGDAEIKLAITEKNKEIAKLVSNFETMYKDGKYEVKISLQNTDNVKEFIVKQNGKEIARWKNANGTARIASLFGAKIAAAANSLTFEVASLEGITLEAVTSDDKSYTAAVQATSKEKTEKPTPADGEISYTMQADPTDSMSEFITNYLSPYFSKVKEVVIDDKQFVEMTLTGKAYGFETLQYIDANGNKKDVTVVSKTGEKLDQVRVIRIPLIKDANGVTKLFVDSGSHGYGAYTLFFKFDVDVKDTTDVEEVTPTPKPEEQGTVEDETPTTDVETPALTNPFKDVSVKNNIDEILALYNAGITTGTTATTFSPNKSITRAQFAVMIARALDLKATKTTSFKDVKGKWYESEVQALVEASIVTGVNATTFNPNAKISRQQAAAMMYRMLEYKGYTATAKVSDINYKDAAKIQSYAKQAVAELQAKDVMTGSNGSLKPTNSLTRDQMAKILKRALELVGFEF